VATGAGCGGGIRTGGGYLAEAGNEGGGTRTHYLEIKSLLLYLLSYAPGGSNLASQQGKLKAGSSASYSE
jgi:hypothetical protein